MRKSWLLALSSASVVLVVGMWQMLRGDGMDAFKCYPLAPVKFKERYQEETSAPMYQPRPQGKAVDVVLNLGGSFDAKSDQFLVIYSNKADAIVYRGSPVKSIKVRADDTLRKDGGGDNLKFQLLDAATNTLCVCQQQTNYNIWDTGSSVAIAFLSGRHMDAQTGTPRRFLVDGN